MLVSAATHGMGDDARTVDARSADADDRSPVEVSPGDEWGSVLAVAGLLVLLVLLSLLFTGGN